MSRRGAWQGAFPSPPDDVFGLGSKASHLWPTRLGLVPDCNPEPAPPSPLKERGEQAQLPPINEDYNGRSVFCDAPTLLEPAVRPPSPSVLIHRLALKVRPDGLLSALYILLCGWSGSFTCRQSPRAIWGISHDGIEAAIGEGWQYLQRVIMVSSRPKSSSVSCLCS